MKPGPVGAAIGAVIGFLLSSPEERFEAVAMGALIGAAVADPGGPIAARFRDRKPAIDTEAVLKA